MKPDKTNLKGVARIVDRRTGSVFSPEAYEQHHSERRTARARERFIKGPIPVHWIAQAFSLTPSAGKCAVALFYQRGLSRRDEFKIEPSRFVELGVDKTARHRGLLELEQAGLIACQRQKSKTPVVRLIGLSNTQAS